MISPGGRQSLPDKTKLMCCSRWEGGGCSPAMAHVCCPCSLSRLMFNREGWSNGCNPLTQSKGDFSRQQLTPESQTTSVQSGGASQKQAKKKKKKKIGHPKHHTILQHWSVHYTGEHKKAQTCPYSQLLTPTVQRSCLLSLRSALSHPQKGPPFPSEIIFMEICEIDKHFCSIFFLPLWLQTENWELSAQAKVHKGIRGTSEFWDALLANSLSKYYNSLSV